MQRSQPRVVLKISAARECPGGHTHAVLRTTIEAHVFSGINEPHATLGGQNASAVVLARSDIDLRTVSSIPTSTAPLISLSLPSDDPVKQTERVKLVVDNDSLQRDSPSFCVDTNIQGAQGEVWRKLMNFLRARFCPTGDAEARDSAMMHSLPTDMNPALIRHFLTTEERTRHASCSALVSSAVVAQVLPAKIEPMDGCTLWPYPGGIAMDVTVSAPKDFSRFNVVDTLLTLAQELLVQSSRDHRPSDFEAAYILQWVAVNLAHEDILPEPYLVSVLELAQTLLQKFQMTQSSHDLDNLLQVLFASIHKAAGGNVLDIHRDRLISHLAVVLMAAQNILTSSHQTVESAIQWCTDNILPYPPRRPACINNLSLVYMKRFSNLGHTDDLKTNIALLQTALSLFPSSDPQRADALYNLIRSLDAKQRIFNDTAGLELALRRCQELLDMETRGEAGDIPRCAILMAYGSIILRREQDGPNGAVTALREAADFCSPAHTHRFEVLAELSRALVTRHDRSPSEYPDDLEEASSLRKQALELAPANESVKRAYMIAEEAAIFFRMFLTEEAVFSNLQRSIDLAESAMPFLAKDPDRHTVLELLGRAYILKYVEKGDTHDIDVAHSFLTTALDVASVGAGLRLRAKYLAALAQVYRQPETPLFDLQKAYRCLENCLEDIHSDAMDRLTYMRYALRYRTRGAGGSTYADDIALAKLALRAVRLLPGVAYIGMDIEASLTALRRWENMATEAAVLCNSADMHNEAVQVIEEGRAIFWSQALKMRPHGMSSLPLDIKAQLIDLSKQMNDLNSHSSGFLEYARKRRLGEELESLLTQIRAIPGHEEFGTTSLEQILKAGEKGPVVILISHGYKCIAYALTKRDSKDSFHITAIDLKIKRPQLRQYIALLDEENDQARKGIERGMVKTTADGKAFRGSDSSSSPSTVRAFRRPRTQDVMEKVLRPLWYNVAKPIISALNITANTGRDRSRLWWCLTGDFTFLPLHAAGDYRLRDESCSRYIVSSYTPTLAALVNARRTFEPVLTRGAKVLLAAAPRPFEGPPLKGTVAELKQISTIIPQDQLITLPPTDDVILDPTGGITAQTAMKALPETSILHLASHGVQDHNNPLNSAFILRDEKLTIAQLIPLPMPHAFLAFLSACETAKGDEQQTDQAIHLAATMLFAGFKSVIGTMWSMSDVDGPYMAGHVYRRVFSDGGQTLDPDDIPYALDEAVEELRARNVPPSRWATFIHLGM